MELEILDLNWTHIYRDDRPLRRRVRVPKVSSELVVRTDLHRRLFVSAKPNSRGRTHNSGHDTLIVAQEQETCQGIPMIQSFGR
jgi:hypothetical protein